MTVGAPLTLGGASSVSLCWWPEFASVFSLGYFEDFECAALKFALIIAINWLAVQNQTGITLP